MTTNDLESIERLNELVKLKDIKQISKLAKEGKLGVDSLYFDTEMSQKQYDRALKWIEALRSGEFNQGKGCLAEETTVDVEEWEDPMCYCCLGVANKIFNLGVDENSGGLEAYFNSGVGNRAYRKVGLTNRLGRCGNTMALHTLTDLNDNLGYDFDEIADILEVSLTLVKVKG